MFHKIISIGLNPLGIFFFGYLRFRHDIGYYYVARISFRPNFISIVEFWPYFYIIYILWTQFMPGLSSILPIIFLLTTFG